MSSKRLLVIDDEREIGLLIANVAETCGYVVSTTERPTEFKSTYDAIKPDVVVLDLAMPETDGIELLRFLADRDSRAHVLIISGCDHSVLKAADYLGRTYGLKIAGVIAKPLRVANLRAALNGLREAV